MSKPRIGITMSENPRTLTWNCLKSGIQIAGGVPTQLRPSHSIDCASFDGFLISGGADINPSLYGQENTASHPPENDRDAMEKKAIEHCLKYKKPLFGICRGAQIINAVCGGTLHQEANQIFEHFIPTDSLLGKILERRPVTIHDSTWLKHHFLEDKKHYVNSLHHQAIDDIASPLRCVARDEFGMVQGVESIDEAHYISAVQWHPEFMLYCAKQRGLFKMLVEKST